MHGLFLGTELLLLPLHQEMASGHGQRHLDMTDVMMWLCWCCEVHVSHACHMHEPGTDGNRYRLVPVP